MEESKLLEILKSKKNYFFTGVGGSGKTFTLTKLKELSVKHNKIVYLTATTGVAADNLNGTTIHRFSGIKLGDKPLNIIIYDIERWNSECIERWNECELLVIDEISMLGKKTLELLDKVARYFSKNDNQAFGGLQIIFCGDFAQLKGQ